MAQNKMTDTRQATTGNNSATTDADGSKVSILSSQDVDAMLASISPQTQPSAWENKEQRNAPRYRVKWNVEIVIDDKSTYRGFINDISTGGASICLNSSLHTKKCKLRIHVPPLSAVSRPHLIEATGKFIYIVFDGRQQLFRLAISFLAFHPDSDRSYLGERLTRYHSRIHDY